MPSNRYYDEWDTPRSAVLLRETTYLVQKFYDRSDVYHKAPAGEQVLVVGRMTEDSRDFYGGKWLYSAQIRGCGALIEEGIDFQFTT